MGLGLFSVFFRERFRRYLRVYMFDLLVEVFVQSTHFSSWFMDGLSYRTASSAVMFV